MQQVCHLETQSFSLARETFYLPTASCFDACFKVKYGVPWRKALLLNIQIYFQQERVLQERMEGYK